MATLKIANREDFDRMLAETAAELDARAAREPAYSVWQTLQRQLHAMQEWSANGTEPTPEQRQRVSIGLIAARELEPPADVTIGNLICRLFLLSYYWRHWPQPATPPVVVQPLSATVTRTTGRLTVTRILLSVLGGLLTAFSCWCLIGLAAGLLLGSVPAWQREGEGAITGFFLIGPIAGCAGLLFGAWIIWRFAADSTRQGKAAMGLAALLGVIIVAFTVILMPKTSASDVRPDRILVEVKMPRTVAAAAARNLVYELRSAGEFDETPADVAAGRPDGDAVVVPGSFRLKNKYGFRIFAVMSGDQQLDVQDVEFPSAPGHSTEWGPFQTMRSGAQMRWRISVEK